jgi:hypothetical protein
MGRTLEDMISSESPEVVQRAKALAEEQLVCISVTKHHSHLDVNDVHKKDDEVVVPRSVTNPSKVLKVMGNQV